MQKSKGFDSHSEEGFKRLFEFENDDNILKERLAEQQKAARKGRDNQASLHTGGRNTQSRED
jgi:hypothetical protein